MQIIGTRQNSMFRVDATYFRDHPTFTAGVDPTTGGPVKVVDDFTDTAPIARRGQHWVVETDPASQDFRRVVSKPKPKVALTSADED